MVMLMPVLMFMFQHFGVDAIQSFEPLGFLRGHLSDCNWHWWHQALRGRLRSRPVQAAPAGQGPRHLLRHVLRLDQHRQHGLHYSCPLPEAGALF